jgi:hypothetical protein
MFNAHTNLFLPMLLLRPTLRQVPYSKEDYEAAKARDPEFYRDADSLQYGQAPVIPEANVDRMVAEMAARWDTRVLCLTAQRQSRLEVGHGTWLHTMTVPSYHIPH